MPRRPAGLANTSQPSATHNQETVGAQVNVPSMASTLLIAASATIQRAPTIVSSGTIKAA
jgi:hypothetical protein